MKFSVLLALLSLIAFTNPLCGQITGEVSYKELGLTFEIPEGWVGQEAEELFLMGHSTVPGLIILIPHEEQYSREAMMEEASSTLDFGGGTVLRPVKQLSIIDELGIIGEFEGTIEYTPAHAIIIGLTNPHGNGATVISTTTPEHFNLEMYRSLALEVAQSFHFEKSISSTSTTNTSKSDLEDWKYQLGGTRLTFMESYNSGGLEGGGYNMSTEIHLCPGNYFKYYDSNFMTAGGNNSTVVSAGQGRGNGSWEILIDKDIPLLVLTFHDNTTMTYELEWREDTKLYLSGYRYFRTWEGDYAPNCDH